MKIMIVQKLSCQLTEIMEFKMKKANDQNL